MRHRHLDKLSLTIIYKIKPKEENKPDTYRLPYALLNITIQNNSVCPILRINDNISTYKHFTPFGIIYALIRIAVSFKFA